VTELREALGGEDLEVMQEKTQNLQNASMKIGEAINRAGGDNNSSSSNDQDGGQSGGQSGGSESGNKSQ